MKCNNCFHNNPTGLLKCENCNSPLQGSVIAPVDAKGAHGPMEVLCLNCKTLNPVGRAACEQCNAPLAGSIIDSAQKRQSKKVEVKVATEQLSKTVNCIHCGYPNIRGAKLCMSCKKPVDAIAQPSAPPPPPNNRVQPRPILDGTVHPWSEPVAQAPKCKLRPLPRKGEASIHPVEFEGAKVPLNRANLDASNLTITSKVQATLSHRDDGWYIMDESAQRSTFLLVRGETKLKKGDIILMGDRLFEFEP